MQVSADTYKFLQAYASALGIIPQCKFLQAYASALGITPQCKFLRTHTSFCRHMLVL